MTHAQRRYLAEIVSTPGKVFNGRAFRTLQALETLGLIEVDWAIDPRSDGRHVWRLTTSPTDAGVAHDAETPAAPAYVRSPRKAHAKRWR
jgi:hypothetical protein